MDSLPFKQVDVFTGRPFFGNPVAVVLGAEGLTTVKMQRIAAWTNLSETTFVLPPSSEGADYRLRIFTPAKELPFAGHPTIGSAHAVLESGVATARNGRIKQECQAGIIELEIVAGSDGTRFFLQAPAAKISSLNEAQTDRFAASVGGSDLDVRPVRIDVGVAWLIGDLGTHSRVAEINPRLDQVHRLSAETDSAGITVFGRVHDNAARLHVRSFAPILGVPEDPVCGSGNAAVAAYLAHTGGLREIGPNYVAYQGMALGRAGEVAVLRDDKIFIGGFAVTCLDSRLRIS